MSALKQEDSKKPDSFWSSFVACYLCDLRLIAALSVLVPFMWFFGRALLSHEMFVFRDAAHFYYPLYQLTTNLWSAGEIPLWNPYTNTGEPLLAGATSAVLYPGKLLLHLPLSYPVCYKLYILLHLLLAAAACYGLARRWGASILAAGVCALSYAFSGNVFFQYCNVVFLVGAAWMPPALLAADLMLVERRLMGTILFGAVLAMMTLGGDPQAAYHAGILATLYAMILWRYERCEKREVKVTDHLENHSSNLEKHSVLIGKNNQLLKILRLRPTLLALSAIGGFVLAAVQILPSMQWTDASNRTVYDQPRNIYELLESQTVHSTEPRSFDGLLAKTSSASHHEHVFYFSVGPWRLCEFLWPNISGHTFPIHRRWANALPAEGRFWTPSMYMGLFPFLLALSSLGFRTKSSPRIRWLSWIVLIAVLSSFGWYGLGWLISEIQQIRGEKIWLSSRVGSPFGGLYWLMTTLLPDYVYFRYPAKWLSIAALGMSLLAADGWDRVFTKTSNTFRWCLAVLGALSFILALFVYMNYPLFIAMLVGSEVPSSTLFGPLDMEGAHRGVCIAYFHSAVLCALFWWLLSKRINSGKSSGAKIALIVTSVELALASGWMVAYAPEALWQSESTLGKVIDEQDALHGPETPYRVIRSSSQKLQPKYWRAVSSSERQIESLRWDRDTLLPQYHLDAKQSMLGVSGTMMNYDLLVFLNVAREYQRRPATAMMQTGSLASDVLGVKYFILPKNNSKRKLNVIALPDRKDFESIALKYNPQQFPRAWIVHHIERFLPLEKRRPETIVRRTEEVLFPDGNLRDFYNSAVIESENQDFSLPIVGSENIPDNESCSVSYSGRQVEIEASLSRQGMVVLSDLFFPGWQVEIETEGVEAAWRAEIVRTNRIMRGVILPAGKHRLIFRYRPQVFYTGAIVSGFGWIGLLAVLTFIWIRKKFHACCQRISVNQI